MPLQSKDFIARREADHITVPVTFPDHVGEEHNQLEEHILGGAKYHKYGPVTVSVPCVVRETDLSPKPWYDTNTAR